MKYICKKSSKDLKGVRKKKINKTTRTLVANWSFHQLRSMLEYKAKMNGVPLIAVNPAYSSKTCHICNKVGVRNGAVFFCSCGTFNADENASKVLRKLGLCVNKPDKSAELLVCAI